MVVDDMATSRELITQALDQIGIKNYVTESDGDKAYQRLVQTPVHLVLSDHNMPNISGMQLLDKLRRTPTTQKIGFILVTGRPTPDIIDQAKRLSLNNMIKKPFTAQAMQSCIEKVVGPL
jgi:two-component system chemotaxis response regulator CheY